MSQQHYLAPRLRAKAIALVVACFVARGVAFGQPSPAGPEAGSELTAAQVTSLQAEVEGRTDLDAAAKAAVVERYQQALKALQDADGFAQQAASFESQVDDLPQARAAVKLELERGPAPIAEPPANLALNQLERLLAEREAALKDQQDKLSSLELRPEQRQQRRAQLAKLQPQTAEKREALVEPLQAAAQDPSPVGAAQCVLLRAQKRLFDQQLRAFQAEIRYFDAAADLAPLETDAAKARVKALGKSVEQLRNRVDAERREIAEEQARAARADRLLHHPEPAVREIAQHNQLLAQQAAQVTERIAEFSRRAEESSRRNQALSAERARAISRVEKAGLTESVGRLLQRHRRLLPDTRAMRRDIRQFQAESDQAQWTLFELEDEREALDDLEHAAARICLLRNLPTAGDVYNDLVEVLKKERDYLTRLTNDYRTLLGKIETWEANETLLLETVEEFADFIDRRIFWVRSTTALRLDEGWSAITDAQWVAEGPNWSGVGRVLWNDVEDHPAIYLGAVAALLATLWSGHVARRRLATVGEIAARAQCVEFFPTFQAIVYTLLISVLGPGLMAFVGWRLTAAVDATLFAVAVGHGLTAVAYFYFCAEVLRHACRPKGLAEAHFGWPQRGVTQLRRTLTGLMVVQMPLALVVVAADSTGRGGEMWSNSLGRMALMAAMVALALFAHRLLRPKRGLIAESLAALAARSWKRLARVWYAIGVGLPLLLACVSALGYHYTASQLAWRLNATVWLGVGLLLGRAALGRWVLVARRRLAMQQARERRAALQAAAHESSEPALQAPIEESTVDLSTIDVHTRQLLRAAVTFTVVLGSWMIWSDALPALGILRDIKLRAVASEISRPAIALQGGLDGQAEPPAEGEPAPAETPASPAPAASLTSLPLAAGETKGDVTLAHVLLAVAVAVLTIISNKNLPGLLEISILQRLPLEPAGRYAITTLARYVITMAGLVVALGAVGVGWSNVQWLAAAITFGLGFGLQEIFANLVSGLIILFERPIRLGDVVTVGDTSGTVTKIRMRATTITNWDRQELIVPNKEFITGRVVNWTLTDTTQRLTIKLGVAYGSDIRQVQEILLAAASEHPLVMRDPPPTAVFEAFGESTLDFALRLFLPSLDKMLVVRHELLATIDQRLRDANIEIAFPQREVRIKVEDIETQAALVDKRKAA